MEIALLPKSSLKIKGKHASLLIDPLEKSPSNAVILVSKKPEEIVQQEDTVILSGPGEYEAGGIKIKGTRSEVNVIYSIAIDGVSVLLGDINSLDKMQHKLQEHNIVAVLCDSVVSATFLTSLASNVVIFYGGKSGEISQIFGKDTVKPMQKYVTTADKLPQEMETILLQ